MLWPSTHSSMLRAVSERHDETAWQRFVDLYAHLLYRLCRRHGLQDADAADVVQNVLTRVWGAVGRFDRQRGRFRAWLITITSREIYRHRSRGALSTGAAGDVAQEEIRSDLTAAWVVEFEVHLFDCALERIRREYDELSWRVFERVWIEKQKAQAVAADCGREVQWVYRVKRQILARLRKEVMTLESDGALLSPDPGETP